MAAAIYDATIAAWDSKYAYNRQHPAEIDPSVTTAVTASASPSYPSEHAVTAAAAAAVLAYLFPDQTATVNDMADQAGWSRIIAGVAFPSDVIAGMDLGTQVGQAVIAYANADGSSQAFTGSFRRVAGRLEQPHPGGSAGRHMASVGADRRQPVPARRAARIRLQRRERAVCGR